MAKIYKMQLTFKAHDLEKNDPHFYQTASQFMLSIP